MPGSKDFLRNNAFSLYDLYGHTLAQKPLPRGSRNLPSLVIIKCQDPSASVAGIKTLGSKFSIVDGDHSFSVWCGSNANCNNFKPISAIVNSFLYLLLPSSAVVQTLQVKVFNFQYLCATLE